jgi:hypothetical protein
VRGFQVQRKKIPVLDLDQTIECCSKDTKTPLISKPYPEKTSEGI